MRPHRFCPLAIVLVAVFCLWRIFSPGLLSFDSVDQYDQAVTGRYNDHHPPILAVSLALVPRRRRPETLDAARVPRGGARRL